MSFDPPKHPYQQQQPQYPYYNQSQPPYQYGNPSQPPVIPMQHPPPYGGPIYGPPPPYGGPAYGGPPPFGGPPFGGPPHGGPPFGGPPHGGPPFGGAPGYYPPVYQQDPNFQQGPPQYSQGPPQYSQGPPQYNQGPPQYNQGPPQYSQGPPQNTQVTPPQYMGQQYPPGGTQYPQQQYPQPVGGTQNQQGGGYQPWDQQGSPQKMIPEHQKPQQEIPQPQFQQPYTQQPPQKPFEQPPVVEQKKNLYPDLNAPQGGSSNTFDIAQKLQGFAEPEPMINVNKKDPFVDENDRQRKLNLLLGVEEQQKPQPHHQQHQNMNVSPNKLQANNFLMPNIQQHSAGAEKKDYISCPELPYFNEFQEIYETCKKNANNWVDPSFPPSKSSLQEKVNSEKEHEWRNFIWLRPKDFFKGGYHIFSSPDPVNRDICLRASMRSLAQSSTNEKGIEIDDIFQGCLGDCYFLSSLSSLAETPDRIRRLFISQKTNETCGVYCVRICHEGIWRAVFVDDHFPCYSAAQGPAFSKSKKGQNELWVLILEKAWAKLYCNYERIEAGLTREVLRDLTGAPTKVVWNDDSRLWDEIFEGENKNFIMTAGAKDEEDMTTTKINKGMVTGHAYSLISAHEIKGEKLVKLRNPWGSKEWKGPWGDDDPVWDTIPQDVKKKVGYQRNNDDGIFFMPINDFKKAYGDVQICMVHDNFKYVSLPLKTQRKRGVYIEVDVKVEGDYYFTILQPTKRLMTHDPSYKYSLAKIVVGKRNSNDFRFVKARQQVHREVFVQARLTPGIHVIYCKVDWFSPSGEGNFVLSSYGIGEVSFQQIHKESGFLEKVYIDKATKSAKKTSYGQINAEKCSEMFADEGYGYFYVENKEGKTIKTKVNLMKFTGLRLKKKNGGSFCDTFELVVPGYSRNIAIFRVDSHGYSLNFKESVEMI